MIKVSADGDLQIVTPCLCLFSESSEREFLFRFKANKDCSVLINFRMFSFERYFNLEFNVKFLQDFFVGFDIGDFYIEFSNVAHHEEEND